MTRRLFIELTGDSQDLGTHTEGVSLKFFSAYAKRLREAYQRSAQAVLTGTVQNEGRLPGRAAEVDIRLKSAQEGSLALDLAPVDMSTQGVLVADELPEKSVDRLLVLMRAAANDPDSTTTPRAFRALIGMVPPSVKQTYQVRDGSGRVLDEIVFTSAGFTAVKDPVLASVERYAVKVKGIAFDPKAVVHFEVHGDSPIRATASQALVERAFEMRDRDDLVATIVENSSGYRLLSLAAAASPFPAYEPTPEETADRYAEILAILAK